MEEPPAWPGQERGLQLMGRYFTPRSCATFRHLDMAIFLQHRNEDTVWSQDPKAGLNTPPGSAAPPPSPAQELSCSWSWVEHHCSWACSAKPTHAALSCLQGLAEGDEPRFSQRWWKFSSGSHGIYIPRPGACSFPGHSQTSESSLHAHVALHLSMQTPPCSAGLGGQGLLGVTQV